MDLDTQHLNTEEAHNRMADSDLSIVLHLIDEAIIIVDERQHITVANRGAERIFDYEPGELIGQPLDILLPERYVAAHHQHIEHFAAASGVFHTMGAHRQIKGRRKDGSEFPAEASIARLVKEDTISFAVILRDITARKESERQLMELMLEYERTNQMAELIGDISHDIKTPISVIHANVYLIRNAKKPEEHERRLESIIAAAEKLERLTRSLTTVSQWVDGRDVQFAEMNINDVLNDIADDFAAPAAEDSIRLGTDFVLELPAIIGSEGELYRALANLMSNALRYTPSGGEILLASKQQQDGVVMVVEDTGEGIHPDELPHIFERNFRSQAAREVHPEGSGLGLSIVWKIVEMHAGHITVRSTLGQGSSFSIWLPVNPDVGTPITF